MDDFEKILEQNSILDKKLLDSLKYSYNVKKIIKESNEQFINDNFNIDSFLNDNFNQTHQRIFDNDFIMDIINEYLGYKFDYTLYFNSYNNNSKNNNFNSSSINFDIDNNQRKSKHNSFLISNDSISSSKVQFLQGRYVILQLISFVSTKITKNIIYLLHILPVINYINFIENKVLSILIMNQVPISNRIE